MFRGTYFWQCYNHKVFRRSNLSIICLILNIPSCSPAPVCKFSGALNFKEIKPQATRCSLSIFAFVILYLLHCGFPFSNTVQDEFGLHCKFSNSALPDLTEKVISLSVSGRTQYFALCCHQQPYWNRRLHCKWPADERTWQGWPGMQLAQNNCVANFILHALHVITWASFLVFQSEHRAFALAAEHGCVKMLQVLMEPYNMATMKPNKVCTRTYLCDFAASISEYMAVYAHMCLECTFQCHTCKKAQSQTLFDASCFPPSLLPERGHAPALSCQERPLGCRPTAAAELWYSGWSQYGRQSV